MGSRICRVEERSKCWCRRSSVEEEVEEGRSYSSRLEASCSWSASKKKKQRRPLFTLISLTRAARFRRETSPKNQELRHIVILFFPPLAFETKLLFLNYPNLATALTVLPLIMGQHASCPSGSLLVLAAVPISDMCHNNPMEAKWGKKHVAP